MSFELDLIQSPSTGSTDALRPGLFFPPPPQHLDAPSPELFDKEVAELDLDFAFEAFEPVDESFATIHDSITVISAPSSTSAVYGDTYSSDFTKSDYLIPSEIESYYSLNNVLYGTHGYIHSAVFSNSPPSIPPLHPAEVQFDFGTSDLSLNFVGISSEDLSTAMPPTSVVPTLLPVHVTPCSEAQIAPTSDRPFKCPHSPHDSSKRKHNLKTSKPFKCSICGRRFRLKNNLDRHCGNPSIHRKQMSVSSISKRRFDPNPDLPHGITINGDSKLTTSAASLPKSYYVSVCN
ncbi:hypothetical protein V8E52_004964 [Russula decolorans]